MSNTPATTTGTLALFARGPLEKLSADVQRTLRDRASSIDASVRGATTQLIDEVRANGDKALKRFARDFDRVTLESLEVPRREWDRALNSLDPSLRRSLERAAKNIAAVHSAFRPQESRVSPEPGITVVRRPDALARVGIYAPGGRAAYPSSLLMGAVPARAAGVRELIVCTPPGANGLPSDVVLAAAALAGVDRVFAIGGAGAIAAMALGTESVPRVDRIVGPGNAWVAEAKRQLVGDVAIDSPAGPSELLVLADATADARVIAREMMAQAEHDPDAAVIAVLVNDAGPVDALAAELERELLRQLQVAPRAEIVRQALNARGGIVISNVMLNAVHFANDWAAEHLLLVVRDDVRDTALAALRNAGTIFVGASSSVAFGDYMTGANHVLPTAGAARCFSGLSTLDFVRWTTWQEVTPATAASLSEDVGRFADAEGLPAHAAAARAWSAAS